MTHEPMQIRIACSAEIAQLIELDVIAHRDARRRRFIEASVQAGHCWVAIVQERAAGYGVLDRSFFDQHFLALVVVEENARRQGVATRLVEAIETRCRGEKLFTSTNASNAAMRALLMSMGFVNSGYIEHLDEGDPELIFVKRVPAS
jgi:GNAT superfamily N-acetyltransferase